MFTYQPSPAIPPRLVSKVNNAVPGFAHVVRRAESYAMVPEPWDQAFGG